MTEAAATRKLDPTRMKDRETAEAAAKKKARGLF